MNYESWRATFQSSEQAARAAFKEWQSARTHVGQGTVPVAYIEQDELDALNDRCSFASVRREDDRDGCIPLCIYLPTESQVPEGWKWVPITPTDEMCTAAVQAEIKSNTEYGEPAQFSDIWDSMIEAAPQPRAQEGK